MGYLKRKIDNIKNLFLVGDNVHSVLGTPTKSLLLNYLSQQFVENHIDYYRKICSLLKIKEPNGLNYVRCGREYDGGYVMIDYFPKDSVAYSLGIGDDISWDMSMAERDIPVYMYDHTIKGIKQKHKNLIFHKIGLGRRNERNISTLENLINLNGHSKSNNLILKMDIEGFEYDVIDATPIEVLQQFSQIVIEFHDLLFPENIEILPCLEKLNTLFQVVHIHGQQMLPRARVDDKVLTNYVEVSYLRRTDHEFLDSTHKLPLDIDRPMSTMQREISMGNYM